LKEISEYSGGFDCDFSYSKFTKETLLRLLKIYGQFIHKRDGHWYSTVMKKWGNDEALECDIKVWEEAQLYFMNTCSSLLNIHGDDVVTLMKYMQADPWAFVADRKPDIKNNNHAILTVHTCPILFAIEKEGTGREELQCQQIEPKVFGTMAHYFNPDIIVTPLKVPPRTDYSDICCQWEFKLDR